MSCAGLNQRRAPVVSAVKKTRPALFALLPLGWRPQPASGVPSAVPWCGNEASNVSLLLLAVTKTWPVALNSVVSAAQKMRPTHRRGC
jgi:hypothetical protein